MSLDADVDGAVDAPGEGVGAVDAPGEDAGAVDGATDTSVEGVGDMAPDIMPEFGCTSGTAQVCYTGPTGTENVGVCVGGSQTCTNGAWSSCIGEVLPAPTDACDTLDNNCNGMTDEFCACTPGATQPCGSDVGLCKKGTQTCSSGMWGTCAGGTNPTTETCDGADNNCNGQTDEGCP